MKNIVLFCIVFLLAFAVFPEDVIIDGFDFKNHDFSTPLEKKAQNWHDVKKNVPNQVVIGHSQGALTALGYIKKEKETNTTNSNIRAFISVDSPVRGFAGLDYGYSVMRNRFVNAAGVHTRGVGSAIAAIPLINVLGDVLNLLPTTAQLNLVLIVTDFMSDDGLPMKDLINTIVNKSSPDSSITEISDMAKSSEYVKKYVGYTTVTKVKYISRYAWEIRIRWEKGLFGITYPVPYLAQVPLYAYRDVFTYHDTARRDIPIGHVIGTDRDPFRMALNYEGKVRTITNAFSVAYGVGGGIHTGLAVATFPFGTLYHANHAANCFTARAWNLDYIDNWGDLIGGRSSDAFIATGTQTLPDTDPLLHREIHVDHKRSAPGTNNPLTEQIWGPDGEIFKIKERMELTQ